jgi:hypothetical protein
VLDLTCSVIIWPARDLSRLERMRLGAVSGLHVVARPVLRSTVRWGTRSDTGLSVRSGQLCVRSSLTVGAIAAVNTGDTWTVGCDRTHSANVRSLRRTPSEGGNSSI